MDHIKCIIIDDEQPSIDVLVTLIKQTGAFTLVKTFLDPLEALAFIRADPPELVFMDIKMPRFSGIELAQKIMSLSLPVSIIFITAYEDHVLDALRSCAVDYLLKPVGITDLWNALDRYQNRFKFKLNNMSKTSSDNNIQNLVFRNRCGSILVKPEDILFISAEGSYSEINLTREKKVIVTMNIGRIEEMLDPAHFIRVHRSVIINRKYVFSFDRFKKKCELVCQEKSYWLAVSKLGIHKLEESFYL